CSDVLPEPTLGCRKKNRIAKCQIGEAVRLGIGPNQVQQISRDTLPRQTDVQTAVLSHQSIVDGSDHDVGYWLVVQPRQQRESELRLLRDTHAEDCASRPTW